MNCATPLQLLRIDIFIPYSHATINDHIILYRYVYQVSTYNVYVICILFELT